MSISLDKKVYTKMDFSLFPKSEAKILRLISKKPGIRLGELIKEANISYETARKRLDYLLNANIIREEDIVSGKKILIKQLYPNIETEQGKMVFRLLELEEKGFK